MDPAVKAQRQTRPASCLGKTDGCESSWTDPMTLASRTMRPALVELDLVQISVGSLVPCVCDRKPPKEGRNLFFVPCPNRVLWGPWVPGSQCPADCADQTKATAECGAAMWLAGDNAW